MGALLEKEAMAVAEEAEKEMVDVKDAAAVDLEPSQDSKAAS
jgi:hypothetical protein